jgi:hypothetical protein
MGIRRKKAARPETREEREKRWQSSSEAAVGRRRDVF